MTSWFAYLLDLSSQHDHKVEKALVSKRQWLSERDQKNILIRLVIKDGKKRELSYEPGDHVAVFPTNSDEDVELLLKHMTNLPSDLDSKLRLMEKGSQMGKNKTMYVEMLKYGIKMTE